jgi:hypothetical protein
LSHYRTGSRWLAALGLAADTAVRYRLDAKVV